MNPLLILVPILGGLIVAGLLGWVRKPRLVVFVPKLFTYSPLTDKGLLVEITLFNRGFKTEEAIELNLSKNLSYTIAGSNNEDIILQNNKCSIARIGPSDEATVLLLVEGGTFEQKDIQNCTSKETKGTVVDKFELVPMPAPQRVAALVLTITLIAILTCAYFTFDYYTEKEIQRIKAGTVSVQQQEKKPVDTFGWKIPSYYNSSKIYSDFISGKIKITIGKFTRNNNKILQSIAFENNTSSALKVTTEMTTVASEKKIPIEDRHMSDIVVFPNKVEERKLSLFIPINSNSKEDKTVFAECFLSSDDETLSLKKVFTINQ